MTRRLLAVLVLVVAVAAACGVPRDAKPRAIDSDAVPGLNATTASTAPVPPGGSVVTLYFVSGDRLVPVQRTVQGQLSTSDAIDQLLSGPSDDERAAEDLTTSIPEGTELRGATLRNGLLTLNLNSGIENVVGGQAKVAYAQMVFTALERPDVDRVRFEVNGKPVEPLTDQGNQSEIDGSDYLPPLNPGSG